MAVGKLKPEVSAGNVMLLLYEAPKTGPGKETIIIIIIKKKTLTEYFHFFGFTYSNL